MPFQFIPRAQDLDPDAKLAFQEASTRRDRDLEDYINSLITKGSGVPTIAGNAGDYYLRTDTPGTVGQRIYVCTVGGTAGAATWVATAA